MTKASLLIIIAVGVAHTLFLSESSSRAGLDILWDSIIVLLTFTMAIKYISLARKHESSLPILIAGFLSMVTTIHLLRFFFGGLPV